jgi:hypothetical protein
LAEPSVVQRLTGESRESIYLRVAEARRIDLRRFLVRTEGHNMLGLRGLCQRYCEDRWIAKHLTPQQAAQSALDEFKRALWQKLEML